MCLIKWGSSYWYIGTLIKWKIWSSCKAPLKKKSKVQSEGRFSASAQTSRERVHLESLITICENVAYIDIWHAQTLYSRTEWLSQRTITWQRFFESCCMRTKSQAEFGQNAWEQLVINKLPQAMIEVISPYQKLRSIKPTLSYSKVFGGICSIVCTRSSFDKKEIRCIFNRYNEKRKGSRWCNPTITRYISKSLFDQVSSQWST